MVYACAGRSKCFWCRDVGCKCFACTTAGTAVVDTGVSDLVAKATDSLLENTDLDREEQSQP